MTASQNPMIEAVEIAKKYGGRTALDGVSLTVKPGEVVGLLGPNGAGKTTTLSILATLIAPDSGRVMLNGAAVTRGAQRRMLGFVPQSLAMYPSLSAAENLRHFARIQGLSRREARDACAQVLDQVGLTERESDSVASFSGGMKRRLNLAIGIVHGPSALLLDEPTVGVDPQSRERILGLVRRHAEAGAAVIYSTHYMEEAERICDRVLLIDRGKLVASGGVAELIAAVGTLSRMQITYRGALAESWVAEIEGARELPRLEDGRVDVELASVAQVAPVLNHLRRLDVELIDFSLHSPNLADAFISITGRTLRDDSDA
jgi:ABC-2 type transport system ATP-binding protein